jgi:hypothetical protein
MINRQRISFDLFRKIMDYVSMPFQDLQDGATTKWMISVIPHPFLASKSNSKDR